MTSMIELVAKAIYDAPDPTSGDQLAEALMHSPFVESAGDAMTICRSAARAAIEAMREPTPEMIAKACPYFVVPYEHSGNHAWQDMIKAALEEK